jgi:hypothetical protein
MGCTVLSMVSLDRAGAEYVTVTKDAWYQVLSIMPTLTGQRRR